MLYNPPTGGAANDPYVGKNVAAGIQGSKIPPAVPEFTQREIVAAIAGTGGAPTNGDLTQLLQAISTGVFVGAFGGTGDALTATLPGGATIPTIRTGMRVTGLIGAANLTATPTLSVTGFAAGFAAAPVRRRDGSAMAAGDLIAAAIATFRADATGQWRAESMVASDILALILANPLTIIQAIASQSAPNLLPNIVQTQGLINVYSRALFNNAYILSEGDVSVQCSNGNFSFLLPEACPDLRFSCLMQDANTTGTGLHINGAPVSGGQINGFATNLLATPIGGYTGNLNLHYELVSHN